MSDAATNNSVNSTGGVVAPKLPGGATLPFPPTPSASIAGRTLQESTYAQRVTPPRLHEDSPNIVIVLIDDAGPGLPTTFGGEVRTATMDRICAEGVSYNRFHTTAMCSPTRASLLTGRNHHEIGNGQIAELANDWDGYAGTYPAQQCAGGRGAQGLRVQHGRVGQVAQHPGARTPRRPAHSRTGPPGLGFEYFYGFLAGEASQYEPHLVRNTTVVRPPKTPEEGYHLSEDLADDAINWLRNHKALQADRPFFMYWASGCLHGPHHIMKEWADRYAGKFDDGWDAYRQRVFERAKEKGWIPQDCELTDRDERMKAWDDIPEDERPFQRRLMEVAAGFAEHCDVQVGRIVDELDRLGYGENTLFLYIWGDNGSSAEGQDGTIAELLAQNGIPTTPRMHIDALEQLGGLDVLGSPKTDNQYHSGWGWAGSTPYKGVKLLASHLGGTRNPLAIRWPKKVAPDPVPRDHFLHCNDVVPTIYDIVGIEPPLIVNGVPQIPIAGASFARTLTDRIGARGKEDSILRGHGQPGHLSRRLDGLNLRSARALAAGIATRNPRLDTRQRPLGAVSPRRRLVAGPRSGRRDARQARADARTVRHRSRPQPVLPIGGGLWVPIFHPELRITPPYREWEFPGEITRIPEFCAPALGSKNNIVTVEADLPADASGVLYALGGFAGGVTCYLDDGYLCYEYNCFIISRTKIRSTTKLPPGPTTIVVETRYAEQRPAGPLDITIQVGQEVLAKGRVPVSAPLLFTANDCFDIGVCLGSPVSLDYYDKAPFPFDGQIDRVHVAYT